MTAPVRRLRAAAVTMSFAPVLLLVGCSDDDGGGAGTGAEPTASETLPPPAVPPGGTAAPGAGADAGAATPVEDVFGVDSPWNVSVAGEPVHPASAALLRSAGSGDGVHLGTRDRAVPVVSGGVPTLVTCRQVRCGDGGADLTLDIPADVDPDPLSEGWLTVLEPEEGLAHDLWRARREGDGSISHHYLRTWHFRGPGFNQPDVASAHGSGLPLLGGLVRPGELERCQVDHALAISVPHPSADHFVQPASWTDGDNRADGALPEGARLRLDTGVRLDPPLEPATGEPLPFPADRRARAECLVEALQRYGAFVVGRAAVPTLHLERVEAAAGRPPLLGGWELQSLVLDDFSVVDFTDQQRFAHPPADTTSGRSEAGR